MVVVVLWLLARKMLGFMDVLVVSAEYVRLLAW